MIDYYHCQQGTYCNDPPSVFIYNANWVNQGQCLVKIQNVQRSTGGSPNILSGEAQINFAYFECGTGICSSGTIKYGIRVQLR